MEQNKVNTFAAKFKKAFSEAVLNDWGRPLATVIGCGSSPPIEW